MKVIIPESIEDVTLGQHQEYIKLVDGKELDEYTLSKYAISVFCNIPLDQVENISKNDFDYLSNAINVALKKEAEFKNIFNLEGIEFGFLPSLKNDDITTREFMDLQLYPLKNVDTHHKLMAILFRKVTKKDPFGNYQIEAYSGTAERAELFKKMPMNIVNGALVFFLNLQSELLRHFQRCTAVVQAKV